MGLDRIFTAGCVVRKYGRIHPKVKVRKISPNQSERSAGMSLIVLHSTESHDVPRSAKDLEAVANWFANPAAQASSHVIVDADGHSARCVSDRKKAWTCVNFNSVSLNIEQIGFASFGRDKWRARWREIRETARWIARWSKKYGIPIRLARVSGSTVTRSGVTTHAALGAAGGGHHDPGPYPMRRVLILARLYRAALR